MLKVHTMLVQGKFEQFQYGEAYSALTTAFRSLAQYVLAEPEEELAEWRQWVLDMLAPNARLMVDLVPELELIIGEQPAVAELPPAEARNRLHIVLTNFLHVFSRRGHSVVLFLDDLQWSDVPTLELLRRLVTSRELDHSLLIGAYRSNEVGTGHPLLIMLDVDHFKAFNDNYGHQAGDDCLAAVATAVRAQLQRPADLIARYGGEEFIIILPDTDRHGVTQMGEMVRSTVEALAIRHEHSSAGIVVTVSAGTASMVPVAEEGTEHLLREADNALYRTKRMGRNQVHTAPNDAAEH